MCQEMEIMYNFEWTASRRSKSPYTRLRFFIRNLYPPYQRPVANKEGFSLLLMVALLKVSLSHFSLSPF